MNEWLEELVEEVCALLDEKLRNGQIPCSFTKELLIEWGVPEEAINEYEKGVTA